MRTKRRRIRPPVHLNVYSRLKKLMRLARQSRLPEEYAGIIMRAEQRAALRAKFYENSVERRIRQMLKNASL